MVSNITMLENFYSDKMEAWFNNDFSKFLLIFFFLQLDPLVKRKEFEGEQINYTFFFKQQLILITENKQKICGTFSLERSFANFSSKKRKQTLIHTDHMSLSKDYTRQLNFIHKSPRLQFIAEGDKIYGVPFICGCTSSHWEHRCFPILHTNHWVDYIAGTLFHNN